jgi:hypothetical protein
MTVEKCCSLVFGFFTFCGFCGFVVLWFCGFVSLYFLVWVLIYTGAIKSSFLSVEAHLVLLNTLGTHKTIDSPFSLIAIKYHNASSLKRRFACHA